ALIIFRNSILHTVIAFNSDIGIQENKNGNHFLLVKEQVGKDGRIELKMTGTNTEKLREKTEEAGRLWMALLEFRSEMYKQKVAASEEKSSGRKGGRLRKTKTSPE